MDFWSRLIAGTSLSSSYNNKAYANNPDKRLARFKREFNQLLQTWRNVSNISRDPDAAETVRGILQELTSILNDESRRPAPHQCLSFASTSQIYIPIGKIATTSYNEPIIRETVSLFSTLIESEEEDFLESDGFSKSLMNLLVQITGANSMRLSSETEVEVVELAFGIAAKIRLQPEILPAWFTTHESDADVEDTGAHEKFAGKTHKEDFPLFYLLIDYYIHHDGRVGDFARTGLLYIIESASTSIALEQWLVESDLATLMATGLGALYSQLSRKLVIDYQPENLPSILALSDYQHPITTMEIVSSASGDFQTHMDTFLSHLIFWQDVLEHCKSVEVKQTLLEHFQVIFLQQILYPSLLESSDVDGGSSVAALTYLRRILESVEHPDMIHLILHYLLALPDTIPVKASSSRAVSAARKKKSMDLATMMASQSETQATPILFNLVDLLLGSLKSNKQQTISVTLQLLSVILRRNHRYAVITLLSTSSVLNVLTQGPQRTIGVHDREMEFLLALANEIGTDENIDESYENHVKDCMCLLESHPCSVTLIAPKGVDGTTKLPGSQASIPGSPRDVKSHTLRQDDPVLKALLNILETFFINPVETNLCLTETIIDLATCGFMHIEGWLLPDPSKYTYEDVHDDSDTAYLISDSFDTEERAQIRAIRLARRTPRWPTCDLPELLQQLQNLVSGVSLYRSSIPQFDELLLQRRQALQSTAATPSTTAIPQFQPPRSSFESSAASRSASPPPSKPSTLDSLAQRIFPDLGTPSQSGSPRGRQSQDQQSSGGSHSVGTPSIASTARSPLAQYSLGLETPSGGNSRALSSSPLRGGSDGLPSQAEVFADIDETILARRVGMPSKDIKGAVVDVGPNPELKTVVGAHLSSSSVSVDEDDSDDESDTPKDREETPRAATASLSHVLTNIIVLQEFLLELAALVQVRAGLFGEVSFV